MIEDDLARLLGDLSRGRAAVISARRVYDEASVMMQDAVDAERVADKAVRQWVHEQTAPDPTLADYPEPHPTEPTMDLSR